MRDSLRQSSAGTFETHSDTLENKRLITSTHVTTLGLFLWASSLKLFKHDVLSLPVHIPDLRSWANDYWALCAITT